MLALPQEQNSFQKPDEFNIPSKLQYLRNRQFIGRNQSLARLHELMASRSAEPNTNVVVIQGIGGVGKTQLASEYAYRHQNHFSSIFWISGVNEQSSRLNMRESLGA